MLELLVGLFGFNYNTERHNFNNAHKGLNSLSLCGLFQITRRAFNASIQAASIRMSRSFRRFSFLTQRVPLFSEGSHFSIVSFASFTGTVMSVPTAAAAELPTRTPMPTGREP